MLILSKFINSFQRCETGNRNNKRPCKRGRVASYKQRCRAEASGMDCPLWRAKRTWPPRPHAAPAALRVSAPKRSMDPCDSAVDAKKSHPPSRRAAPQATATASTSLARRLSSCPPHGWPPSPVEEVWSGLCFELLARLPAQAHHVLLVVRSFPARQRAANALIQDALCTTWPHHARRIGASSGLISNVFHALHIM